VEALGAPQKMALEGVGSIQDLYERLFR